LMSAIRTGYLFIHNMYFTTINPTVLTNITETFGNVNKSIKDFLKDGLIIKKIFQIIF